MHTILVNCKTVIPHDEVLPIKRSIEGKTKIMKEKEYLSDNDFDRLIIIPVGGISSKDDITVCRGRG